MKPYTITDRARQHGVCRSPRAVVVARGQWGATTTTTGRGQILRGAAYLEPPTGHYMPPPVGSRAPFFSNKPKASALAAFGLVADRSNASSMTSFMPLGKMQMRTAVR